MKEKGNYLRQLREKEKGEQYRQWLPLAVSDPVKSWRIVPPGWTIAPDNNDCPLCFCPGNAVATPLLFPMITPPVFTSHRSGHPAYQHNTGLMLQTRPGQGHVWQRVAGWLGGLRGDPPEPARQGRGGGAQQQAD